MNFSFSRIGSLVHRGFAGVFNRLRHDSARTHLEKEGREHDATSRITAAPSAMTEYTHLHQLITRPGDGTRELVLYLGTDFPDLNAVDAAGHTLLMVALKYRKQERALALLVHGSDLRRANNAGWNVFHWAAFMEDGKLLTLLAQHTLRRWSTDTLTEALAAMTSSGKTPKDMASGKAQAWLERCGASRGAELCGLVWGNGGQRGVVSQVVPWQEIIEPPGDVVSWLGGVLGMAANYPAPSRAGRPTPRSAAQSPLSTRASDLRCQPMPRNASWPELQSMVAATSRPAPGEDARGIARLKSREVSWLEVMAECARAECPTIGMAQRAPATPPARNPRRGLFSTPPSREAPRPESPPTQPICRTQPISRTTRQQAELRYRGEQPSERPTPAAAPPAHTIGAEAAWKDVAEAHVPSTVPSPKVALHRRGAVRVVVLALMIGCVVIASCVVAAHARSPLGWI